MSTLSRFAGGAPTTSIVNFYSSGGVNSGSALTGGVTTNAKEELSGLMSDTVLKTVLTVTGGGEVPLLFVTTKDTTSRTVRVQVTVDGAVVFDATSSAITTSGHGVVVVGQALSTSYVQLSASGIRFNASLVVQLAYDSANATETDKLGLHYILNKR